MCGICGIVGTVGPREEARVSRMLRRLVHRGPDEQGLHRESGVALGARRLRVIDPLGGRQPAQNEDGSVWAALNGEIYNYRALRQELMDLGHRFASRCDTEVLVHLYEQEGIEGLSRLRGMFAFAIWDRDRQEALLVRDRLGIKPLYYAIRPGTGASGTEVVFSSELPSLLEALPDARIRPQAIADYLTALYVPGPDTLYEGVYQLRPGEALRVGQGRIEVIRYYRVEDSLPSTLWSTAEEAKEQFVEVFRDTVHTHLVSDVPVGLFLSGGMDSAAVLAMMQERGPVKTFTIGYEHPEDQSYNELAQARFLATHFGTDHTEAILQPDIRTLLPRVVEGMGEPFADSSAIPTYLLSEVARRSVMVALSGIGGDELFGGYPRYLGLRLASSYQALPRAMRAWLAASVSEVCRERGTGRDHLGRVKRFVEHGHRSLAEQYRRWTTFIPAEWEGGIWSEAMKAALPHGYFPGKPSTLFEQWPSGNPMDRAMGLDLQTYLPDDLLRMGDRMSMAHSLELRVPFCDHLLLACALRISPSLRLTGWQLKGFMRSALRGLVPAAILDGPKQGFMIPLARWLREDLREMAQDLLSDAAIRRRGYVTPQYVRWLMEEHRSGRRNCADQLYALMVLELWHERASHPVVEPAVAMEAL
ncbi:MAG: Asparagine synthetase (glutamine-hydrolyzing) [Nitrospira sp.]|nr:MAG: Asparagine synthetase (glutamine-hydrolyzing) [Nitrospira sp.]